jgi:hypothetical protein
VKGGEDTYSVGPLHLRTEPDPVSETWCFLVSRIPGDGKKSKNPVILKGKESPHFVPLISAVPVFIPLVSSPKLLACMKEEDLASYYTFRPGSIKMRKKNRSIYFSSIEVFHFKCPLQTSFLRENVHV